MKTTLLSGLALAALSSAALAQDASLAAPAPFPLKVPAAGGGTEEIQFAPVANVSEPWNICVLIPHLKDSLWVSFDYGVTTEARRLGLQATVFQAGSYNDLPKQVSQFENCITGGYDAILVAPISEAGLTGQISKAREAGIPVVGFGNPISEAPVTTQVMTPPEEFGAASAAYLKERLDGAPAKAVLLPGPLGAGWAEGHVAGFRAGTEGTGVEVLAEQYGEPSVATQLRLVENAVQTYPGMTVIWGGAPTIEAAVGVMADAGLDDMILLASYANQATFDLLAKGDITALNVQFTASEGWMAVDLAVRALEGEEVLPVYYTSPRTLDAEGLAGLNMTLVSAPDGFQPVFSVE